MSAFRVTILILLSLTVGLMFYAFVELLPARQSQYEMYQTELKIKEYEKRQQEHEARMARIGADVDAPEVAAAKAAAAEEDKKNAADLTAAEEHSVIASVKRRQEIEESANAAEEAAAPSVLGVVTSYLEDCTVVLFKPNGTMPVNEGLIIAIRRDDFIVCEATVDGKDEISGQITAAVKSAHFGGVADAEAEANQIPRAGDEVIISPFPSSCDLRLEEYGDSSIPQNLPAPAPEPMPEVEGVLRPIH